MSKISIDKVIKEKLEDFQFEYDNSWNDFEKKLNKNQSYIKYYIAATIAVVAIAVAFLGIKYTSDKNETLNKNVVIAKSVNTTGNQNKKSDFKTEKTKNNDKVVSLNTTQKETKKSLKNNEIKQKVANNNKSELQKQEIKPNKTVNDSTQENLLSNLNKSIEEKTNDNTDFKEYNFDVVCQNSEACVPANVIFNIKGFTNELLYKWKINGNEINTNNSTLNYKFTKSGVYDIVLEVYNKSKLITKIVKSNFVTIHKAPKEDFSITKDDNIYYLDGPDNYKTINWFVNGKLVSKEIDPEVELSQIGKNIIKMHIEDVYHCKADAEKNIDNKPIYQMANAFTPDMNGDNETFGPIFQNIDNLKYYLYIYDLSGKLIFKSKYANQAWDGTEYNTNKIAHEGKYIWQLVIIDNYNNKITDKGQLTLKK